MSLAIADVDHFKALNDERGHDQGDKESGGTLTENGGDRVGHEGTDHIERTVGDIGDAQYPQDQA